MGNSKAILTGHDLISLWVNECQRIFYDRLVSEEDQAIFYDSIQKVLSREKLITNHKDINLEKILDPRNPLQFVFFMDINYFGTQQYE
jgi:hypothetical protein